MTVHEHMRLKTTTRITSLFLTLVMVMSLFPFTAFAEDEPATVVDTSAVYVSSSGNDTTGDGTQTFPYATVAKAYTAVATGGTIYLLSDLTESSAINFNIDKIVTITSTEPSDIKTIYSKVSFGYETRWFFNVNKGHVIFTNITIDGIQQKNTNGNYYAPGAIVASNATVTIDSGTTIQNFKKNAGNSGGAAVVKSADSGAVVNIKDGVTIKGCVLETGSTDDPAAVLSSGTGAILYMTGGTVTGNTLSTSQENTTAVVNIGKISNPHFWMTGGEITGNTINNGAAAVYMRGEANACDIQFGDTAYVYGNYVNGADGDQKNIFLKNDKNGNENDNVFVKLCSALTSDAKLGVYAEMIGVGTKVAQGTSESKTQATSTPTGSTYTATVADTAYFVSDKATAAEILYCGGSEDTCGLLTHSSASPNHEKAIYLSISPAVSASKGTAENTIDASISRCASDATYVVLDKEMKPVTGKKLSGGEYGTDGKGTFTLSDADATTTIGVQGLLKDSGPYTVMLVGTGGLSVDSTTGKASTDNLTDIATINVVNFAGEGVTWSDDTNTYAEGDFDIVTVAHNDQTGKANKSYTAATKTGYAFTAENPVTASGNLGNPTVADNADGSKTIAVEVPAYGTTSKGTTNYNTVTLTGTTVINTGVKLLDKTDGEEMADGKTYDGVAVAHTDASIDGATLSYTWQKKNADGSYSDIANNAAPSDAGDYNLKVTATKTDGTDGGTENLPFTISPKALTVTATVNDKTYDGGTTATLKSAAVDGVLDEDKENVSLNSSKIAVVFTDKNAGDSKAVTATAADDALSGDKAGNYTIGSATAANAKISPKTVTATITANSKIYDGSADATVSTPTLTGAISGDSVSAVASDAVFVGGSGVDNNKTVTADIALTGDDAGNYTLEKTTASATANITAKELGVTATAKSKTYDGTTDTTATVTLKTDNVVEGDSVSLDDSNMKAKFDTAAVGDGKTVTVTGLTLTGTSAKNYKLPNTITTTASITQATGSGTVKLDGWTYGDEANSPKANSTTNPETDTDKISYQYKLKDADDDTYTNTVPTNAGEYTVKATFPANDNYGATTATTDFTISPKALTVNVAAANKVYDGTTDAKLNTATLVGVAETDKEKVTLVADGVSAAFNTKNAGTDKAVTLSGSYTLDGDAAKNYTVTQPTELKADITAASLTITGATVTPKTYDGTDSATVTDVTFEGLKNCETLKVNVDYAIYSAKYDNVNATGTSAATKVNFNVVLNSTDVTKNYTLTTTAGSQEATIGKANHGNSALSTKGNRGDTNTFSDISAYVVEGGTVGTITTADDDIFDSTPTYDSSTGALSYTLKATATESQTATVTLPVTSTNYNDYTIVVTVGVTPKETVEISIDGKNYVYDGNAHAPAGITVAGNKVLVKNLEVTYEGAEGTTYEQSETAPTNAGKYIMTVKVPESNTKYIGSATCAFEIAKKPITATITAEDKVYDGKVTAKVVAALDGVVENDEVTAVVTNPAFADKNVGTGKTVTAAITLSGNAASNYTVNDSAETTANITAKTLTISPLVIAAKFYDGTNKASFSATPKLVGVESGDEVILVNGVPTFSTVAVGRDIPINFTDFTLEGPDKDNYTLVQPTGITAEIGAYIAFGSEYTTTTTEWTNQDFVVTAKSGWQVSTTNTADGEWSDTLTRSNETGNTSDSLTFYVRNTSYGFISEVITENYKIDKTVPVISGAENNKTYCAAVTVTIADENLDTVTLNGEPVSFKDSKSNDTNDERIITNKTLDAVAHGSETVTLTNNELTLIPAVGTQTVVATDKAGNSTSIMVTVNDGHLWGAWTSVGDGAHHKRICQIDTAHIETADCVGGVATCSATAVCEVCGGDYGELDPQNHVDLKHVDAKEATANAEGNIEYWYCDGCDTYYKDARATTEIAKTDTVIAKLKPASTTDAQAKAGDESASTTKVLAETGDESMMFFWMALLLASIGTVVTTTFVARKKKHNK